MAAYVELKGYSNGRNRQAQCKNGTLLSLDEIAKELNMSKRNFQRTLRMERNLTDLMKELLDTDEITKTFASDTIASMGGYMLYLTHIKSEDEERWHYRKQKKDYLK